MSWLLLQSYSEVGVTYTETKKSQNSVNVYWLADWIKQSKWEVWLAQKRVGFGKKQKQKNPLYNKIWVTYPEQK